MASDDLTILQASHKIDMLPENHMKYLIHMRDVLGFHPKVCYDLGSCVLHWSREAERVWPDTQCVLFEANTHCEHFYKDDAKYKDHYHIGLLSAKSDEPLKYYTCSQHPGGNSYYKENNDSVFPEHHFELRTSCALDDVVNARGFPAPDLVKMDVQGAELDIIRGGMRTLAHAKYLIVELQHVDYNRGAPKADVVTSFLEQNGWQCIAPLFQNNGADGDYCFVNLNHKQQSTL